MDYRGVTIRKRAYSGKVIYNAIRHRRGSNFGRCIASRACPIAIMRAVDDYIDAGGSVAPITE